MKKITHEESSKIIETYKPLGCFWLKNGDMYIGIDNRTGDAWVEEFKTFIAMYKWILGYY